jgi:hypothetical protein
LLATTGFAWLSLATVGVQQPQPNYAPIEIFRGASVANKIAVVYQHVKKIKGLS